MKNKNFKIGIIGNVGAGILPKITNVEYTIIDPSDKDVINSFDHVIVLNKTDTIDIEGQAYELINDSLINKYKFLNNSLNEYGIYSRKLPNNIDLINEYRLIKQKKSKLSKWKRDEVEHLFLMKYKPVGNL